MIIYLIMQLLPDIYDKIWPNLEFKIPHFLHVHLNCIGHMQQDVESESEWYKRL